MRESIGTAWIMGIVATFIALFSGYLAFSVNYSKSFRVKDGIVERIHKNNGFNDNAMRDIADYINTINYNAKGDCYGAFNNDDISDNSSYQYAGINIGSDNPVKGNQTQNHSYNYCVAKVSTKQQGRSDITMAYYKVVVFYSLQIGNWSLGGSMFKTTGETQSMSYPQDIFQD